MVIGSFLMDDKRKKSQFFKKIFLLADISMNVTLKIFFIILSNTKVNFTNQKLKWRSYIIAKAFPITKQIELVRKKEYIVANFDPNDEIFVVHVAMLASSNLDLEVYFFW